MDSDEAALLGAFSALRVMDSRDEAKRYIRQIKEEFPEASDMYVEHLRNIVRLSSRFSLMTATAQRVALFAVLSASAPGCNQRCLLKLVLVHEVEELWVDHICPPQSTSSTVACRACRSTESVRPFDGTYPRH
eukprot:819-Heterococcus_DN1.PRE.1